MSTRFRLFRILLPLLALWLASCELSSQSGGTSDDTHSSISVSGRVLTQESKPLSAVVVHLRKANLSDTTDGEGKFSLVGDTLPASNSATSSLDTLDYLRDGILVHSAPVHAWIETMPDVYLVQRDISGALSEIPSPSTNVVAKIWNSRGQSISIDLDLNTTTKRFSGFAWFRSTGGLDSFKIQIRATDAKGRPTGQSQELSFTSRAGDLQIPDFDPNDLLPRITFTVPPTGKRGATIVLHAEVKNLTDWGIQYEWSIGSGSWKKGRTDTAFAIPDNASDLLAVRVRAIRSDSLATTDSVALRIVDSPAAARRNARPLIADSNPLSGAIRDGQVDWFKFPVDSGATYSAQQGCPRDPCPVARTLKAYWGASNELVLSSTGGQLRFTAAKTDSVYLSFEGKSIVDGVTSTSFGYWDSANYSLSLSIGDITPPQTTTTRAAARALPLDGQSLTGTLRVKQIDWFKFAADSGRTYGIQQSCPQSPCPEARTLKAQWKPASAFFDSSASGLLRFTAAKTDSVYVSFEGKATIDGITSTSFGYWDSVNYALALVDEYALSIKDRNDAILMVNDGVVRTWDLKKDRSLWYRFHVDSGTSYRIDKSCPVPLCPEFTTFRFFLDSAAAPFLTSTTAPAGFTASRSATAYVQVEGTATENGNVHTSFSYWTSLHLSLSLNSYNPDVLANATTIPTDGSIVQGNLAKTEIAWYKFQAKGNTAYRIQKSCNTPSCLMGTKITLVSYPSMEVIAYSSSGLLNYTTKASGDFLVKLQGATVDDAGPYTLWAVEYDNTMARSMATAIPIAPGATSKPRLARESRTHILNDVYFIEYDTTWYTFHGDSGSSYKFTHPDLETLGYRASFWNTDSIPVATSLTQFGSTEETFACTKTGTYFYRIYTYPWPWDSPYMAYSARLETSSHLPFWLTGVDDYEPDSTMQTASLLKPDSAAVHHTLPAHDVDWTRIHVDSGKVYLISLEKQLRPYTFSLYAADSTLLQFQMPPRGWLATSYHARTTTDIFLRISALDDSLVYDLRVWSPTNDSYESDDTLETAKPILTDGSIQHRILNGTYDYIKFHADSGKRYLINLHVTNSNTGMAYELLASKTDTTSIGWGHYQSFVSRCDQDVFLGVDPKKSYTSERPILTTTYYEASVNLDPIDTFETDNSLSTAKPHPTDGTIAHHNLTFSDNDWISFEVDSAASYSIKIDNPQSASIAASLYNSDSSQIGSKLEGTDTTFAMQVNARRKTTYYLNLTTNYYYSGPTVQYAVTITRSRP